MSEDRTGGAPDSSRPAAPVETTIELLTLARQGDHAAIERLFARHLKPLQRFARGRLPAWARDLTDTDDLVQDALLQTFKRLENFESRHPGALQAYLRQAVMNRLRDELRRQARGPEQSGNCRRRARGPPSHGSKRPWASRPRRPMSRR